MANETETRTGTCPTHGTVDATREVPRVTFPPLINTVRRTLAKRRPYRCPECNAPVS